MKRPLGWFVVFLWVSGCAAVPEDGEDSTKLREELMQADRAFGAAARERGLDGWMEFMANDATRLPGLGEAPIKGTDAIRKADAPLFADRSRVLLWEPAHAGIFQDSAHGFTTGKYRMVQKTEGKEDRVLRTGSYITWWRKEKDGKWRVILDTGAPDPPRPPD